MEISVETKAKSARKRAQAKSSASRTFKSKGLEEAFISFCQLVTEKNRNVGSVPTRRELLEQLDDRIAAEEFDAPTAEKSICGENLLEPSLAAENPSPMTKTPGLLGRLCEPRLLSPDEERSVFLRMNYLKHRGYRLIENPECTEWDRERASALLQASLWHRDLIVKANMRLVVSIVKKIANVQNPFDEMLSDGIVALMRAVNKFDPTRGFRFSTYATQVVRRECYHQVHERHIDRSRFIASELGEGLDAMPEPGDNSSDQARWLAWRERLSVLLPLLSRREQVIIRSRFCLGAHRQVQTLQRLADLLGISKERVRQLEQRALIKLRELAEQEAVAPSVPG
ncbi:MAG: sigma-70 family RNA polymerase sigma factor [Pirellulales bacterium]